MKKYVVAHLYGGCVEGVYDPFSTKAEAVRGARELCPNPEYDTNKSAETEYPIKPDDEVYVYEIGTFQSSGICHLTLAG